MTFGPSKDIIIPDDRYDLEDANVCRHRGRPSKVEEKARRGKIDWADIP